MKVIFSVNDTDWVGISRWTLREIDVRIGGLNSLLPDIWCIISRYISWHPYVYIRSPRLSVAWRAVRQWRRLLVTGRRLIKAWTEKRFKRYERKIFKHANSSDAEEFFSGEQTDSLNQEPQNGLGKEPSLDSLLLAYGFAEYAGLAPDRQLSGKVNENLNRAKQQLDITQRA